MSLMAFMSLTPMTPHSALRIPHSSAAQLPLPIRSAAPVVLASISGARQTLREHNLDEDDILALIDDGTLFPAWNIAVSPDSDREIRIWPTTIDRYAAGSHTLGIDEAVVIDQLLAPFASKPFATATQLRTLLNCSGTHIQNLIRAAQLTLQPDTTVSRGPYGVALITIGSIRTFLTTRLL